MSRPVLWIGLLSSLAAAYFVCYRLQARYVRTTSEEKARLLLTAMEADRYVTSKVIKPALWKAYGHDKFVVEAMSSSFGARNVFNRICETYPEYHFKHACLDPRNRRNLATGYEREIIAYFRRKPHATEWSGVMTIEGERRVVVAKPIISKPQCLKCHGRPQDAPQQIRQIYGTKYGYNRKPNELIGALVVSIPLQGDNPSILGNFGLQAIIFGLILLPFILAYAAIVRKESHPSDHQTR